MRWILIGGAVITLILGILALYNPTGFVIAIAFLIGIWMFVLGLFQVFAGIADRSAPYWWLTLIVGIIGVIVGLYIMTQPRAGGIVLVWVLGNSTRSSSASSGSSWCSPASGRATPSRSEPLTFFPSPVLDESMSGTHSFEDAVSFHGHRCPGLALGYRAAGVGLEALGADPSSDEEVVAVVENDACGVDGLQVRAGCTFGKGNLRFLDYGKHVYTFYDRASGRGVRVAVTAGLLDRAVRPRLRRPPRAGPERHGDPGRARRVRSPPPGRLRRDPRGAGRRPLRRDPGRGPPPEPARIHRSVVCDACGESVSEHRVVRARRAAALHPLRRTMTKLLTFAPPVTRRGGRRSGSATTGPARP